MHREIQRLWIAHVAARQPFDRRRHSGTQQERLPALGAAPQDPFDVRPEANVEHPIRFVEHHDFQIGQRQCSPTEMIEHAARRADDDIGTAAQFFDLPADWLAAVERRDVNLAPERELLAFRAHLHSQLARRHEDQRLHRVVLPRFPGAFQNRNQEGSGFACARAGLGHHVDPGQGARYQAGLNWRGLQILGLGQRCQHDRRERKIGETLFRAVTRRSVRHETCHQYALFSLKSIAGPVLVNIHLHFHV